MAEETKPVAVPASKAKGWRYVGPGSAGNQSKTIPVIGNLPLDVKNTSLGIRQGVFHADELPEEYIEYVMATNTMANGWWIFE